MTEEEDIDGLAGEYVLGSLDPAERRQVDVRRKTDASLAAAIAAWEGRLAPLMDRAPGLAPSEHLFDGILTRILEQAGQSTASADVVPLQRASGRRWVLLAAGAGALAACLVLAVVWFNYQQSTPQVHGRMDCGQAYKGFWEKLDPQSYVRIQPEQLAGVSRMALRAYDACQAGDDQDAESLFLRLQRTP